MNYTNELFDQIVVGGGYTGLSCALNLKKQHQKFLLLEATDHPGGRAYDQVINKNFRLELGGQYIAPVQKMVTQMVEDLGLKTYPAWGKGDNFLLYEDKLGWYQSSPAKCLGNLLEDNSVCLEIEKALTLLQEMFKEVSNCCPWECLKSSVWDGMTFKTWIDENLKTFPAKQFFRFMTNQGFSTEPEQISLLQMLWFFKTSHGLPPWALGGAQANRVEGGTGLLAIKMAEQFQEHIRYSEAVIKIEQNETFSTVYTDKNIYRSKAVIVCMPPQLNLSIQYTPPLPSDLYRSFSAMQIGNSMKVQAIYEKPFWRDKNLSGNGISYNGIPTFTYDNSGSDGTPGVLLGFISASNASEWNRLTQKERKQAVLTTWACIFGPKIMQPIDYIEHDWMQKPFIRGGHGCHFPPGVWKELGPALGKEKMPRFGHLFFAASDIAKDWNGYLEGALYAGQQVAIESLI